MIKVRFSMTCTGDEPIYGFNHVLIPNDVGVNDILIIEDKIKFRKYLNDLFGDREHHIHHRHEFNYQVLISLRVKFKDIDDFISWKRKYKINILNEYIDEN